MKKIELPEDVRFIIDRICKSGHEAFAVGGCVRDALYGLKPHDYDITTDCSPQETEALFSEFKIIETGIKHGTVTVMLKHQPYEITTYRKETSYSDHRHPDNVSFTSNIEDDLSRRDFTINAMAYNDVIGLVDPFNGLEDLSNGIIRCVGIAEKRFEEDALRILRCLRFSSRFNFRIEEATSKALFEKKELLKFVSVERIAVELNQIICSDNTEKYLTEYKDVFVAAIPQIINADFRDIDDLNKDLKTRLTALFFRSDDGLNECETMLRYLHYSNEIINEALSLFRHRNDSLSTVNEIKLFLTDEDISTLKRLIDLKVNILKEPYLSVYDDIDKISDKLIARSELEVTGDDLKQIGLTGKDIGTALEKAYKAVITGKLVNDKKTIIEYVKREMN